MALTIEDTGAGIAGTDEELAQALRLAVTRLARRLRKEADAGVTPSMLSALATIERHGPLTLGELAAAEHVQPPSATAVVGRLEELGLVDREVDASDRRVTRVRLSREGTRLLERSRSRKTAFLVKRLQRLDAGGREALARAVPMLDALLEEDA